MCGVCGVCVCSACVCGVYVCVVHVCVCVVHVCVCVVHVCVCVCVCVCGVFLCNRLRVCDNTIILLSSDNTGPTTGRWHHHDITGECVDLSIDQDYAFVEMAA